MELKLNVPERLALINIIPREGNFINLKIFDDFGKVIMLNEDEMEEFEVKQDGERILFNPKKGLIEKAIEISERAYSLICEVLEKMDNEKSMNGEHISLYEKFVQK